MVKIIKEELPIEESLRKKLELICEFAKTTPTIINGNIRKIDKTSRERGHQDHTDESFKILEQNYNLMISKYGSNYAKGDYGWVNNLFDKNRVIFQEIKDRVDMDKLYGYYKLSSTYIHGNHKANEESLGLIPNLEKLKLVGPSNYGLSIPMQNVAISLVHISTYFFLTYSNLDVWTACSIMNKFLDKIIVESNKVQVKIEQKENKLRKIYSKVLITSFKGKNNSSSILLNNIRANLTDKLELTNSFITSEKELKQKIDKSKYKYIISFGQKPNSNKLYIELFGNKNDDKLETLFPYKKDAKMIFIHIPSINTEFNFGTVTKVISNFIQMLADETN